MSKMRWQNYKYQIVTGTICFLLLVVLTNRIVSDRLVIVKSQNVEVQSLEPDVVASQVVQECECPKQSCPAQNQVGLIDWQKVITNKKIKLGSGLESFCPDLFNDMESKDKRFGKHYQESFVEMKEHLNGILKRNNVTRTEGHSGEVAYQQYFYWAIGSHPSVKTVCEIGFNAGNSALIWLESNPNTKLYSFDINRSKYTAPMLKYFKQKYPGRIEEYFGDSTETVPKVAMEGKVLCDIAVVDGGHFKDVPFKDIINMKSLSKKNTILLIDDTGRGNYESVHAVMDAINKLEKSGYIKTIFMCAFKSIRGFAAFMYM